MKRQSFRGNEIHKAFETNNNNLLRSSLNTNNSSQCRDQSSILNLSNNNINNNQTDNFTQKTEKARSFLSISSNMQTVKFQNTQASSVNKNNTNYIHIPFNSLSMQQYQNKNFNQEKNYHYSNLNSFSQKQIFAPSINSNSLSEAEINERFKIQDRLRKFPQLFNKVFEKKFDLGFPSFANIDKKSYFSVEEKNEKNKFCLKSNNGENKIYVELKKKLIETNRKSEDLVREQKEAYMNFCYLILRIKERSIQAKKFSHLLGDKLEFYMSLNEKLINSVHELNQIFRFNIIDYDNDNYNDNLFYKKNICLEEDAENFEFDNDNEPFLKIEYEKYLEILKNMKISDTLKANFVNSNNKLHKCLEELNSSIDERIKLLDDKCKLAAERNFDLPINKRNPFLKTKIKNDYMKQEEKDFILILFNRINLIMNDVSEKFQDLLEKEKSKEKSDLHVDLYNDDCNQKLNTFNKFKKYDFKRLVYPCNVNKSAFNDSKRNF